MDSLGIAALVAILIKGGSMQLHSTVSVSSSVNLKHCIVSLHRRIWFILMLFKAKLRRGIGGVLRRQAIPEGEME